MDNMSLSGLANFETQLDWKPKQSWYIIVPRIGHVDGDEEYIAKISLL
jgi:hypothetical protein